MGEIEAKVNGCLSNLLLHVRAFSDDLADDVHHFCPQRHRLDVSEEGRKRPLKEVQDRDVVLQDGVLQSLEHQFQEDAHGHLGGQVLAVDLSRHSVSSAWIKIV